MCVYCVSTHMVAVSSCDFREKQIAVLSKNCRCHFPNSRVFDLFSFVYFVVGHIVIKTKYDVDLIPFVVNKNDFTEYLCLMPNFSQIESVSSV